MVLKIRRSLRLGIVVILGGAAIGVSAQVGRQEFIALQERVTALEKKASYNKANLGLLKMRVERLEEVAKGQKEAELAEAKAEADRQAAAQSPLLEGRDLIAWKLAKAEAEQWFRGWSDLNKFQGSYGSKLLRESGGPPSFSMEVHPAERNMTKTSTGDYRFVFRCESEWPNGKKNSGEFQVNVIDFETELRIGIKQFVADR